MADERRLESGDCRCPFALRLAPASGLPRRVRAGKPSSAAYLGPSASYVALNAGSASMRRVSSSVCGTRSYRRTDSRGTRVLAMTFHLAHSCAGNAQFVTRSALRLLDEGMKHDDAPPDRRAVKHPSNAFPPVWTKLEQAMLERSGVRQSQVRAMSCQQFGQPPVIGSNARGERVYRGARVYPLPKLLVEIHDGPRTRRRSTPWKG